MFRKSELRYSVGRFKCFSYCFEAVCEDNVSLREWCTKSVFVGGGCLRVQYLTAQ